MRYTNPRLLYLLLLYFTASRPQTVAFDADIQAQ